MDWMNRLKDVDRQAQWIADKAWTGRKTADVALLSEQLGMVWSCPHRRGADDLTWIELRHVLRLARLAREVEEAARETGHEPTYRV